MTKDEFREYYQQNKLVVIGVPFLIVVILFNQFVLKPARDAKRRERLGVTADAPAATAAVPAGEAQPAAPVAAPAAPPPPLEFDLSSMPVIDPRIQVKLRGMSSYPYGESKNVFMPKIERGIEFYPVSVSAETMARPEIGYHGFLRMGTEKVAILKLGKRLMLTKVGQTLFNTPYQLQAILDDRVILSDNSENKRQFEVGLSQETAAAKPER